MTGSSGPEPGPPRPGSRRPPVPSPPPAQHPLTDSDPDGWLRLAATPGVGAILAHRLLDRFGRDQAGFDEALSEALGGHAS